MLVGRSSRLAVKAAAILHGVQIVADVDILRYTRVNISICSGFGDEIIRSMVTAKVLTSGIR